AVEQHVVERLFARLGGSDVDLQVLAQLLLANEVVQRLRAQRQLRRVFLGAFGRHQAILAARWAVHRASSCRAARTTASNVAPSPSRCVTRATAPYASTRL